MVGRRSTLVTLAIGRLGLVVLLGAWAVLGQAFGSSVGDLAESDADILDANEPNDIDVGLWSQPPLEVDPNSDPNHIPIFCAWNEPARSTRQADLNRQWRMDADDFRSIDFAPVTSVRWWGGYKAWTDATPPELQPTAWHIGIWANTVEDAEPNALFPEQLVWTLEVAPDRVGQKPVGMAHYGDKFPERCFVYDVTLEPEEWFIPAEYDSNERVFWISITAIYADDAEPINLWGWAVRPCLWGRGAVVPAIFSAWPDYDEQLFPGRIYPVESTSLCGEPQPGDMCFELFTEPMWVERYQPFTGLQDGPDSRSELSNGLLIEDEEFLGRVVADDWVYEGASPVIGAVWWGSYWGYGYQACACDYASEPAEPNYFLLTIRADESASDAIPYSRPGEALWTYRTSEYDRVLVGYQKNSLDEPNEPVFRYGVTFPEDNWFDGLIPGGRYWFSVVAVYTEPLAEIEHPWGWTSGRHQFGIAAQASDPNEPDVSRWQSILDPNGIEVDMSFTLFALP